MIFFRTSRISKFTVWVILIILFAVLGSLAIWLWFRAKEKAINHQLNKSTNTQKPVYEKPFPAFFCGYYSSIKTLNAGEQQQDKSNKAI
jgi:cytosine/uracil/thiamine/allantoin permease